MTNAFELISNISWGETAAQKQLKIQCAEYWCSYDKYSSQKEYLI